MGKNNKVAVASDTVTSVKSNPYVQRALHDQDLHDAVREAVDAAKSVATQFQAKTSTGSTLKSDQLYNDLQTLAVSALGAGERMRDAPKKKKRGGLFRKLLLLVGVAGVALAVSESLRSKVLDLLFGPEEEFQYTPSSSNGSSGAGTPSSAAANH